MGSYKYRNVMQDLYIQFALIRMLIAAYLIVILNLWCILGSATFQLQGLAGGIRKILAYHGKSGCSRR